jgi:hypothetical protein
VAAASPVGLVVGGITWTRRRRLGELGDQPPPADQTPEEVLRRRYAADEIDRDE